MKKSIIHGILLGFSLGIAYRVGYVKAIRKSEPVLTECTQWLTTAVDIIESGQYCERRLNQTPEMCLSVCVEEWSKYAC